MDSNSEPCRPCSTPYAVPVNNNTRIRYGENAFFQLEKNKKTVAIVNKLKHMIATMFEYSYVIVTIG